MLSRSLSEESPVTSKGWVSFLTIVVTFLNEADFFVAVTVDGLTVEFDFFKALGDLTKPDLGRIFPSSTFSLIASRPLGEASRDFF